MIFTSAGQFGAMVTAGISAGGQGPDRSGDARDLGQQIFF